MIGPEIVHNIVSTKVVRLHLIFQKSTVRA